MSLLLEQLMTIKKHNILCSYHHDINFTFAGFSSAIVCFLSLSRTDLLSSYVSDSLRTVMSLIMDFIHRFIL